MPCWCWYKTEPQKFFDESHSKVNIPLEFGKTKTGDLHTSSLIVLKEVFSVILKGYNFETCREFINFYQILIMNNTLTNSIYSCYITHCHKLSYCLRHSRDCIAHQVVLWADISSVAWTRMPSSLIDILMHHKMSLNIEHPFLCDNKIHVSSKHQRTLYVLASNGNLKVFSIYIMYLYTSPVS